MPKIGGRLTMTLASNGSIILLDCEEKERVNYYRNRFNLNKIGDSKTAIKAIGATKERFQLSENGIFTPNPDELIRVPFRALSASIVDAGGWRATDFSDVAALKRSVSKLIGVTAFTDHNSWNDKQIGVVESSVWENAKVINSNKIPAGINIVYLIDALMNEKLARSLSMTPPSIYSNSVSIEFEWEPNVEVASENDFYNNIGKVIDGKMVARKMTEVIDYHEASITWMGADPFAKMLDSEGNPVNIERAAVYENLSKYEKDLYENKKHIYSSFSYSKKKLYLNPDLGELNNDNMNKKLESAVKEALGLKQEDTVTDAHLEQFSALKHLKLDAFSKLESDSNLLGANQTELDNIKTEKVVLEKDKNQFQKDYNSYHKKFNDLTAQSEGDATLVALANKTIEEKRTMVTDLYKKAVDKAEDSVLTEIKEADNAKLDSLAELHLKKATSQFTATCKSCGKNEFEFKSSLTLEPKGNGGGKGSGNIEENRPLSATLRG